MLEESVKEIKEIKDQIYHQMLEPSLIGKVASLALAAVNLIYVFVY